MTLKKGKSLLHYWINLLHYREVLHYWLIFITLSGSITLSGVYYITGAKCLIDIFQDIPLVCMAAILKTGIRIPLGILSRF